MKFWAARGIRCPPLTTDMMEKIAMSPLIRNSIFNHCEEGLRWALGRSRADDQRSWDSPGAGGHRLGFWREKLSTQGVCWAPWAAPAHPHA